MTYRVQITCDKHDARSIRTRDGCGALKARNPIGEWETAGNAADLARRNALEMGWTTRRGVKAPSKFGWVCPACNRFMDEDKEARHAR